MAGGKAAKKIAKGILDALDYDMANSAKTQRSITAGSYQKARDQLDSLGVGSDVIDYGAGKGHGAQIMGAKSYEPFPQGWTPDFTSPPDQEFDGVVNMNVLNVIPEPLRSEVAAQMLNAIKKDGYGIVGARSYPDVMSTKNKELLPDGGIMSSDNTYQYGFGGKNEGLVDYLTRIAEGIPDKEFDIKRNNIGATGALVNRLKSGALPTAGAGALGAYALSKSNNALADPVSDLRTSEAQFNMSPEERAIDDLRASEREFGNYDEGLADAYSGASTLWNNVGTSLKNVGVPAGMVDLMQPTYKSSAAKAAGDDSAMTGLFAMLEKLDPVAYAGLLGSEYLKRNK